MKERAYSAASVYRYGFNGKETDPESSTQDYGMRIYNPALGKFLSVDPIAGTYPWYTPYQFAGNTPIWAIDMDGKEPTYPNSIENYLSKTKSQIKKWDALFGIENVSSNTFHIHHIFKLSAVFQRNATARNSEAETGWLSTKNQFCQYDCITSVVAGLRILFDDYTLKSASGTKGEGTTYNIEKDYLKKKGMAGKEIKFGLKAEKNSANVNVPVSLDKDLGQQMIESTKNEVGVHAFMGQIGDGYHTFIMTLAVIKNENGTFDYTFSLNDDLMYKTSEGLSKADFNKALGQFLLWIGSPNEPNPEEYKVLKYDNGDPVKFTGEIVKLKKKK